MVNMIGVVEKLLVKEGAKDGKAWKKTSILVNGEYHGSFDPLNCNEGDKVSIEYELSKCGKYRNIKSVAVIESGQAVISEEKVGFTPAQEVAKQHLMVKIISGNYSDAEIAVNLFNADYNVRYTQSHASVSGNIVFVLFYEPKG